MAFFDGTRERPARPSGWELEVFGDTIISRGFLRGGDRLRDMRPAWHEIHDLLLTEWDTQFATQGGRASGGWAPLAESTVRRKRAMNMDNGILQRTMRLRDSLTEKGHSDHVLKLTKDELVVGSSVPYGPFHQGGTARMPARPPAALREQAKRGVSSIMHRHAMGAL